MADPSGGPGGWTDHQKHLALQEEVRPAWVDGILYRQRQNLTLADGSSKTVETCTWFDVVYDTKFDNLSLKAAGPQDQPLPCSEAFAELGISPAGHEFAKDPSATSGELLVVRHSVNKTLADLTPSETHARPGRSGSPSLVDDSEEHSSCFGIPQWFSGLGLLISNNSELFVEGQGIYRFEESAELVFRACFARNVTSFLPDLSLTRDVATATLLENAAERRERRRWLSGGAGFSFSQVQADRVVEYEICSLQPGDLTAEAVSYLDHNSTILLRLSGASGCEVSAAETLVFFAQAVALRSAARAPGELVLLVQVPQGLADLYSPQEILDNLWL